MDPAKEAAEYLTGIFVKMGVPCRVENSLEKGKHVISTVDIPERTELFEEVPIVSWPTREFLELDLPFCSYCLRQLPCRKNVELEIEQVGNLNKCSECGSFFCSSDCQNAFSESHRILCSALQGLREFQYSTRQSMRVDDSSSPITRESLARCIVWIVSRVATQIRQIQLTGKELVEDHKKSTDSISRRIFNAAIEPFNRLICTPEHTEFSDVDTTEWYEKVQQLLKDRCRMALLEAAADPRSNDESWATEIVEALFRRDTLNSLTGQLTLNAQGLNVLVSCPSLRNNTPCEPSLKCVLKGGGVYALQSAFNHSCVPNTAVHADESTHVITLRTLREVKRGEELTITYIPLENTSYEGRQERLKGYFFTCSCPLCLSEMNCAKQHST